MSSAIMCILSNVATSPDSARGLESVTLRNLFDCDYIGQSNRLNSSEKRLVDFDDVVDINYYSTIFLQLTPPNFFGGKLNDIAIKATKLLSNFKNHLKITISDPRIKPYNPAQVLWDRFGEASQINHEDILNWNSLLENATYVFPGQDISKFIGYSPKNVEQFDYFTEIFKSRIVISDWEDEEKLYDVVYYGDNRGGFRERVLRWFMPSDTDNLLIAYKTKQVKADFMKKVKSSELISILNSCKVSLLLYDLEHADNVVTFRFYETLASNCLLAIPIEFDPQKRLIQNETLRDTLYVSNSNDVKRLASLYSKELIDLQKQELIRMFNQDLF